MNTFLAMMFFLFIVALGFLMYYDNEHSKRKIEKDWITINK